MLNINLLPWRAQTAKYQFDVVKRMLAITCLIVVLLSFCMHHYLNHYLHYSQQKILDYQTQLQHEIHYPQQSFQTAKNLMPNIKTILLSLYSPQQQIHFTELRRKNKTLLIKGTTNLPALLAHNIMNLKLSKLFPEIFIREIKPLADDQTYFVLETKYAENL